MKGSESLDGKVCMVTGATSGHGKALARGIADLGAEVVLLGRDSRRCHVVQRQIEQGCGRRPRILVCDLASRRDIERAAAEFLSWDMPLHVLVNNAGLVNSKRRLTIDGLEETFAVNYLAAFQLSLLLLERLRNSEPAKIINVASDMHKIVTLDLDNLGLSHGYSWWKAYSSSKLALVYFTHELAQRLQGEGVSVFAVDPGPLASNIAMNNDGLLVGLAGLMIRRLFPSPERAAKTALFLAAASGLAGQSGGYFKYKKQRRPRTSSRDPLLGRKLWQLSARLTGVDMPRLTKESIGGHDYRLIRSATAERKGGFMADRTVQPGTDFIRAIISADIESDKHGGRVQTRFPPEPNGYLHIGHAKSICLNFGVAAEFGGKCNLRFDDTNPSKEDVEYTDSIREDVRWLGFDWENREYYASDYFEKLYEFALRLVKKGLAYVCDLSAEEIRAYRGTLTEPGRNSPFRERPVEENLDLFRRMKAGEFEDGSRVLRAKIDMASPNIVMRDPTLYRIRRETHQRTGDSWCIYPMYDFAHCLSDAIEDVTHSLCTLEFENNRELYDWIVDAVEPPGKPRQIEFARLNLSYTVLSKRKLLQLVESGKVSGWDDPRMPTLCGLRRRGYTPESIRKFCERIGLAKRDSMVDVALLEYSIRDDLNYSAARRMCVLRPLKVVIDNYPEGKIEEFEAPNLPDDPEKMGSRKIPFSREIFIERTDFMQDPPRKFFRLAPGREVRLRWAYFIKCERVVTDEQTGEVIELHCSYDPASRGGNSPDGRKVKGTIHWVSAGQAITAKVRLYDRLFMTERPGSANGSFTDDINPDSLEVLDDCRVEPSLASAQPASRCQFERQGYFILDPADSRPDRPVFNRIVPLRDSWAKLLKKGKA